MKKKSHWYHIPVIKLSSNDEKDETTDYTDYTDFFSVFRVFGG
jgi:hypothetical protein